MSGFVHWLLPGNFLPHGHCYLWRTDVLWLHVSSDGLIAGSYYAIPLALAYVVRRRRSVLPYWWMPALFAAFIFLCGTTHLFDIWTIWHPDYIVDGLLKLLTAVVSAATAVMVFVILPQLIALRTPIELQREVDARTAELRQVNLRLRTEIETRERSESALRASEARSRATFDHAGVAIAHVAPDGRFLEVNPVWRDLTGYTPEELLARTTADITHPEDLADDRIAVQRLLDGGGSYAREKRYLRKDGGVVWARVTVALIRLADGRPDHFVSVVDDITDRKRAQEVLQEKELHMRLALQASGAATWIIDYSDEASEHFDARSCELAGFSGKARWPSGTFCALLHPDDRPGMQLAFEQTRAASGPGPMIEYRIVRADGQVRWLQGAGIIQRTAQQQPRQFIGVSIDITARKRLESELRETIDKLAEADRRKDEFLATLAHELRNPLAPIRNGVQILKLSATQDERSRQTIQMMERQMSHLVRLVDDLLDISRITQGKVQLRQERLLLKDVLVGALESSWTAITAKRLEIVVQLTQQPTPLRGDHDRLTQVFSNILSNAIKYTGAGGKLWVGLTREGHEAVVSIRDTGVGIPPDSLERVFEMFSQLRPSGQGEGGLGIGLALVRQLVHMHGGQVQARSEGSERGSEFIVRLPLLEDEELDPTRPGGADTQTAPDAAGRVLVVDDHQDAAESLAALLQMLGHEVRIATDGSSALAAVQAFHPAIVFMDIGMPGMSGLEAARRIRQLDLPSQPLIVALTGWGQDADRERSREAGMDEHLVKPIELDGLRAILEQAAERNMS